MWGNSKARSAVEILNRDRDRNRDRDVMVAVDRDQKPRLVDKYEEPNFTLYILCYLVCVTVHTY